MIADGISGDGRQPASLDSASFEAVPFDPAPFDIAAEGYDQSFTDSRLGRWLRGTVWRHLDTTFATGDRVLEIGCGSGEDATHLASRGVRVVATDPSQRMLEVATAKARRAAVDDYVEFARMAVGDGGAVPPVVDNQVPFDGAFSNFGAVNCIADRSALSDLLAERLRPGAKLVLVVMGPLCPWESVALIAQGRPRDAFRRWRSGALARVADGTNPGEDHIKVWYPTPRRLGRDLADAFIHRRTVGIGCLLPHTQLTALVDRWPRAFGAVARLDRLLSPRFPFSWLSDHYLSIFERR